MVIWIVLVVVIVVLVALAARGTARRGLTGVDPTQLTFDPQLMAQVKALAVSNRKIEAIKMLREGAPGLSLVHAKNMVDRMAVPPAAGVQLRQDPPTADSAMEWVPSSQPLPLEVELEVRALKAEGQAVTAIKAIRDATGWPLRESKEYFDAL